MLAMVCCFTLNHQLLKLKDATLRTDALNPPLTAKFKRNKQQQTTFLMASSVCVCVWQELYSLCLLIPLSLRLCLCVWLGYCSFRVTQTGCVAVWLVVWFWMFQGHCVHKGCHRQNKCFSNPWMLQWLHLLSAYISMERVMALIKKSPPI